MNTHSLPSSESARATGSPGLLRVAVVVGLVLVASVVILQAGGDAESKALRALPAPERRALYERTRQSLLLICNPAQRSDGLESFCTDEAGFIAKFPECDQACADLASRSKPLPRR